MKYATMIIAILFISFASVAQDNGTYVEVAGRAVYQMEVDRYQTEFEINAGSSFNKADRESGLEELKDRFFQRAKELDIEQSRFRVVERDSIDIRGNDENHLKLAIDTDSKVEFHKILSLNKVGGWVYKTGQKITYRPFAHKNEAIIQALEYARQKGGIVAAAMDKKLGKVLVITDYNFFDEFSKPSYTPMKERTYRIRVRFEVE